jgi:hypothetical protein
MFYKDDGNSNYRSIPRLIHIHQLENFARQFAINVIVLFATDIGLKIKV